MYPDWRKIGVLSILTGKPTGKRPLGRLRRRWQENIRVEFKVIDISSRNWIDSAQDREKP